MGGHALAVALSIVAAILYGAGSAIAVPFLQARQVCQALLSISRHNPRVVEDPYGNPRHTWWRIYPETVIPGDPNNWVGVQCDGNSIRVMRKENGIVVQPGISYSIDQFFRMLERQRLLALSQHQQQRRTV